MAEPDYSGLTVEAVSVTHDEAVASVEARYNSPTPDEIAAQWLAGMEAQE